ncbi:O-antigen ligase family protein [Singulisphaera rosea]
MSRALFFLLSAAIILMPAAFFPELADVPTFEVTILACLVASLPRIFAALTPDRLAAEPISVGVLAMELAVVASFLSNMQVRYAYQAGMDFFKVLIFYLVLTVNIDSPRALIRYLAWLGWLIATLTALAILQYHQVIDFESLRPLERNDSLDANGETMTVIQLRGNGFFHDPNDLCLALLLGTGISLYFLRQTNFGFWRYCWNLPVALFGYAFTLTRSRGGFVGLIAGMLGLFIARFGVRKAIPLAALALPVMTFVMAGRATELSTEGGTAQQRIQLWSEGFGLLRQHPAFGIGQNMFVEAMGHDAHNSFVQAYTDLGLFGGTVYFGIFAYAGWSLLSMGSKRSEGLDPDLARLHPYMVSIVLAYAAGMLSLTRVYVIPTYLVAGLASTFLKLAPVSRIHSAPSLTWRLSSRILLASLCFLGALNLYVRLFARGGGGG